MVSVDSDICLYRAPQLTSSPRALAMICFSTRILWFLQAVWLGCSISKKPFKATGGVLSCYMVVVMTVSSKPYFDFVQIQHTEFDLIRIIIRLNINKRSWLVQSGMWCWPYAELGQEAFLLQDMPSPANMPSEFIYIYICKQVCRIEIVKVNMHLPLQFVNIALLYLLFASPTHVELVWEEIARDGQESKGCLTNHPRMISLLVGHEVTPC